MPSADVPPDQTYAPNAAGRTRAAARLTTSAEGRGRGLRFRHRPQEEHHASPARHCGCRRHPDRWMFIGTSTVVTVTAPPETAAPTVDPASDDWEHARAFAEAVFKSDYEAARPHVAPKGPAERYLTHQVARSEAASAAGNSSGGDDPELTFDDAARTVTADYDGDELVWKAFTYDSAGLVMGWETGAGIPVVERLWSKPAKANTRYATVTLVSGVCERRRLVRGAGHDGEESRHCS